MKYLHSTGSDRSRAWRRPAIAVAALATALLGTPSEGGTDKRQSSALWRVVHDLCVVDKRTIGLPAPCTAVELNSGVALVKDAGGHTGYLLVPTRRLTGIEDPALLADNAPNYWQMAWQARSFVERRTPRKLDRTDIAIAVNSVDGRTQNQLHFHIDCVRRDVKESLRSAQRVPENSWVNLNLLGHPYRVGTIKGEDLGSHNPFRLVAEDRQAAASRIGKQTLALVGAQLVDGPGFYLVNGDVGPKSNGHGEELLDHHCTLAAR